jgi:hypothetical protein
VALAAAVAPSVISLLLSIGESSLQSLLLTEDSSGRAPLTLSASEGGGERRGCCAKLLPGGGLSWISQVLIEPRSRTTRRRFSQPSWSITRPDRRSTKPRPPPARTCKRVRGRARARPSACAALVRAAGGVRATPRLPPSATEEQRQQQRHLPRDLHAPPPALSLARFCRRRA